MNKLLILCSLIILFNCSGNDPATPKLLENESISVDGKSRKYDVYLPATYQKSNPSPVILDLHGTGSTKTNQRSFSNFEGIADKNNIVLVWPQALILNTCLSNDKRWNANLTSSPDDVAFISALIDELIELHNVDPNRIYVTGLSNGGMMAYSLACGLSEKIAAIASVAGTMTDDLLKNECQPTRPVPILEIHGTADQISSFNGYSNCEGDQASVNEIISFWRAQGNCSEDFEELSYENKDTHDGCTARMLTYKGCTTSNLVKLLIIDGGGHNWPASVAFESYYKQYESVLLPMNFDIDASEIIWEFFTQHNLL